MAMKVTPLAVLRISRHSIAAHGLIPNTSISKRPLLIYHEVFEPSMSPASIESHLENIGAVQPQWRYTMVSVEQSQAIEDELGRIEKLDRFKDGWSFGVSYNNLIVNAQLSSANAPRYSTTHYHSTTHEVLCVFNGRAKLCFGGENNPERIEALAEQGDVIIVPAGVGHRLLEDLSGGEFQMIGSYPPGRKWDMCYGKEDEESKSDAIRDLPWFDQDPIYGRHGPALEN